MDSADITWVQTLPYELISQDKAELNIEWKKLRHGNWKAFKQQLTASK